MRHPLILHGEGSRHGYSRERLTLTRGPTGVMATACLHTEIGRNTGDPRRWQREPTGHPRGVGRAAWGGGEVHSTAQVGERRGGGAASVHCREPKGRQRGGS